MIPVEAVDAVTQHPVAAPLAKTNNLRCSSCSIHHSGHSKRTLGTATDRDEATSQHSWLEAVPRIAVNPPTCSSSSAQYSSNYSCLRHISSIHSSHTSMAAAVERQIVSHNSSSSKLHSTCCGGCSMVRLGRVRVAVVSSHSCLKHPMCIIRSESYKGLMAGVGDTTTYSLLVLLQESQSVRSS